MKYIAMYLATLMFAFGAQAQSVKNQKARADVDTAATQAADEIKDCGKKIAVTFDWSAYDSLDWAKLNKKKEEHYGAERSNLAALGKSVNAVCADKMYKTAFGKISAITYRATNNDKTHVVAKIDGGNLILENYTFGSTRRMADYKKAIESAL